MTKQFDQSRRSIVKYLSGVPLLPLGGGSFAAALLSACGGGGSSDTAVPAATATTPPVVVTTPAPTVTPTPTPAPETPATPAEVAPTFAYPGLTPNFDAAIVGLKLAEDMNFGSAAAPSGAAGSIAIKTLADLAVKFNPLQGTFTASGGHVGGTGPTLINNEVQRYSTAFNAANHVLDTDGLRLQAVLGAGHFNSYLRGSIVTTGNGLNTGAEGASTPTRLVDIGLTVANLAAIEIGTCVTAGSSGLAVVVAKDAVAGTITFEAVTSGVKAAFKGNWHITFTAFAFARVAAEVLNATTTTIQFKTPVASTVVPGMFAMGVHGADASGALTYTNAMTSTDRARVLSISADRLAVTFDKPVTGSTLKLLTANGANTGDGMLFVPELTSGQIWSKRPYGPHQTDHLVQAMQVEFTMPAMPQFSALAIYSKVAVEAAMAAAPGMAWGFWPAVWTFPFKPNGAVAGYTEPYSEVDILEVFTQLQRGPSTWTGFLHSQTYTRQVALQAGTTTARNGGTWQGSTADAQLLTPNTANLLMPTPIASGTKRTVGVIWTRDKVLHYLDGIPVAESNWPVNTVYSHQLGINLACGSLSNNYVVGLMFPQSDAQATSQFLKVHSVKTWEL